MMEVVTNLLSGVIEAPISYGIARKTRWPCRGPLHVGFSSIAATAITHPQCIVLFDYLHPLWGFWCAFFFVEALVILAEGCLMSWMANLRLDRAMLVSLAANSTSAFMGLVLSAVAPGFATP